MQNHLTLIATRAADESRQERESLKAADTGWFSFRKLQSCEIAPFHKAHGQCGVCGAKLSSVKASDSRPWSILFCSRQCWQHFRNNHSWDLAKLVALHRDGHACTRCGYRPGTSDDPLAPSKELVVRHVDQPGTPRYLERLGMPAAFTNTRTDGCHQHVDNLITVCRACDDTDSESDIESQAADFGDDPHGLIGLDSPEPEPPAAPVLPRSLGAPTTNVKPHELTPGWCNPANGLGLDPDVWFEQRHRQQAKKLCRSCPVILKCAQFTLDMGDTDGVRAAVALPGKRFPDRLKARREELRQLLADAATVTPMKPAAAPADGPKLERAGA